MDGGASSPATATPSESDTISCGNRFDWKFERLRPSRAHPEAEGTDSPPHHPFSDSAEILRISGRGICKEAIFSPGGKPPLRKNQRVSTAHVAGNDWKSRGFTPSRALRDCSGENFGFRRCGGYSFECVRFRRRGAWGAPLPYIPSGDGVREGSHPLALSRRVFGWGDFGFGGDGMVFYGGREKRRRVGGVRVRA